MAEKKSIEVTVTREMAREGARIIESSFYVVDSEFLAQEVYKAMNQLAPNNDHSELSEIVPASGQSLA